MAMFSERIQVCLRCERQASRGSHCANDGVRLVDDLSGELIDERFLLHEPIGAGGMGSAVWRAEQVSTGRDIAVKILRPDDHDAATRFRRGAIIASHLNHPNIITTHAVGRHVDGSLFLVMEHLDGVALHAQMRHGPIAPDRAVALIDQLLGALDHMSRRGIMHLDIKPENLFLVGASEVSLKVLDFDIADVMDEVASVRLRSVLPPRTSDRVCGTPQYMAPEVLRGERADHRADVYAAGVLLFQLLTGALPYRQTEPQALAHAHRASRPRLAMLRPFGRRLTALLSRALRPNPKVRFDDAGAMRWALRTTLGDHAAEVTAAPREIAAEATARPPSLEVSTTMPCRPAPARQR